MSRIHVVSWTMVLEPTRKSLMTRVVMMMIWTNKEMLLLMRALRLILRRRLIG